MLLIAVLLILTGIFFEDTPFRKKDALGFIVVDLEFIVGETVVNFV